MRSIAFHGLAHDVPSTVMQMSANLSSPAGVPEMDARNDTLSRSTIFVPLAEVKLAGAYRISCVPPA